MNTKLLDALGTGAFFCSVPQRDEKDFSSVGAERQIQLRHSALLLL